MRFLKVLTVFAYALLAGLTGGCGGGGASDSSGTLTLAVTAPATTTEAGTAAATYSAADGRNPIGVEISFSTDRPDLVALDSTRRSVGSDGTAAVTFRVTAVQTTTSVKITAVTGGLSTFQTLTLVGDPAAPPPPPPTTTITPNNILVQSVTPSDGKLALKGTGSPARPENGFVTFKVTDQNSTVVPNEVVDFTVSPSNNGGVVLSPSSATTNSSGLVTVGVSAGTTQATIQLTATVRSNTALHATAQMSVTSGPPDQDSFSLAATTLNSETFNHDGVKIPITVRLADHFNNPPPAGTIVLFTTNGGKVDGSAVTDASGNVTVNWESQAPRPSNGRFVILAYAAGEESFTDLNGNGLADPGEFTDTGSAFRDDNENGSRDANEPYIPYNFGDAYSIGDGLYNGMFAGAAYVNAPKGKHIFQNIYLVMSTDAAKITNDLATESIGGPVNFTFFVRDMNANTMAAGTTITVTATNGKLSGKTSFTIPNNIARYVDSNGNPSGGFEVPVYLSSDGTVSTGGAVTITVKSPGGLETSASIPIDDGV